MASSNPNTCVKCGKSFATVSLLNRHSKKNKLPCSSEEKQQYTDNKKKCRFCDKMLCTYNNLKYHENICKKRNIIPEPNLNPNPNVIEQVPNYDIPNNQTDTDDSIDDDIFETIKIKFKKYMKIPQTKLTKLTKQIEQMKIEHVKEMDEIKKTYKKLSDENEEMIKNINDINIYIASEIKQNQTKFQKEIFAKYNNQCIITGTHNEPELEAAYIISIELEGTYDVNNGLLLKENLCVAFNNYYWSIDPHTMKICVNFTKDAGEIKNYYGKTINIQLNYDLLKNIDEHYKTFMSLQNI